MPTPLEVSVVGQMAQKLMEEANTPPGAGWKPGVGTRWSLPLVKANPRRYRLEVPTLGFMMEDAHLGQEWWLCGWPLFLPH